MVNGDQRINFNFNYQRINELKKIFLTPIVALLLYNSVNAQIKIRQDTIFAPYIGFHFSTLFPDNAFSSTNGMHDLYEGPYLDFGLEAGYKFKSNWLLSVQGDLLFGSDNLTHRQERMPAVFSNDANPIVIGTNGTNANFTFYNRALALRGGFGKIFTLGSRNPNSGIVARLYGGIWQQKTIFVANDVKAPQLQDDYARLYDHKRRGFTLTESIGYWFMSRKSNIVNCYIAFEITQCWSHSVRDYIIDEYIGLHGPDNTKYFDMIYGIKLCWMFPLKGKTSYDYYLY